jgi:hypothetical protein
MTVEIVGFIAMAAGLLIIWIGPTLGIFSLTLSTLLGAAAAFKLPSLGDSNVPPAVVIAACFALAIGLRSRMRHAALSVILTSPAVWIVLFTIYASISAVFLPRIFQGTTQVYSLARNGDEVGIVSLPLMPRASNFTQAAYLIADLICFLSVSAYVARKGSKLVVDAVLTSGAALLALVFADLATSDDSGSSSILSWLRNANYRILDGGQIAGFKRVLGPFAEAGAYSYAAIGLYAFSLSLWLDGVRPRLSAFLALLLAGTLLLSTSSTAYLSFAIFSLLILCETIGRSLSTRASRRDLQYFGIAISAPLLASVVAVCAPVTWASFVALFDATIANKLQSQSGIERMQWNIFALQNFWDTATLGAGVGSVRASSMLVSALANVGIVGIVLLLAMLMSIAISRSRTDSYDAKAGRAGARACTALAIAACISASSVDLGLAFFIFAALAATAGTFSKKHHAPGTSSYGIALAPLRGIR